MAYAGSKPQYLELKQQDNLPSPGIARSLALVALLLVIFTSVSLAMYIGGVARENLLTKQKEFAALLADNLNHQIYRRFTLPTILGFGKIDLQQNAQYQRLDQVIQSTVHGLNLNDLRIYGHSDTVSYSINKDELGSADLATEDIIKAGSATAEKFVFIKNMPYWQAFFSFRLEKNSFILRTIYPLRIENRLNSSDESGPIMGVLEFSQDFSGDMESAFRFQQLVLVVTLFSAGILFILLMFFIRRAERAVAVRMQQEQKLLSELHQHEKLAGMGRVVASIAHEIRNPLGIIRSSAELLLKRNAGADPLTGNILQAIYDEAKRLSQTVSDFLDYAKPRSPRRDLIDVAGNIQKALAFLEPELQSREILVVLGEGVDQPMLIRGDNDLLYRAFYNIMGNAMQAMEQGGTLFISRMLHAEPSPTVELLFCDTGPGFPPETLGQMLDPFFTTKDDGTGLGLPIVQNIITGHDGTMTLGNSPEGGACIRVQLPLAAEAEQSE